MTADLVAFLRARLDEDELAARWAEDGAGALWEARFTDYLKEHMGLAEEGSSFTFIDGFLDVTFGAAEHIARHDPARVLRQTAILRDRVDLWSRMAGSHARSCLRATAATWDDHPDYREEWRL